ncbi:MAG: alpha-amylase family glycosyl hydrolase [Firmicutes bacterium]|nr:alpha-amylase family glycosyl hydrolase [Bacillota bacterium]MCL2256452.1 alpha-amylase family glycosyl hydrolase [Bacillota bacterium]
MKKMKMFVLTIVLAFSFLACTITVGGESETGRDEQAFVYAAWESDVTLQRDASRFLGVVYTPEATTFRIWSPDTPRIRLVLDPDGRNGAPRRHDLVPMREWAAENGYWENRAGTEPGRVYGVTVQGDLWLEEYIFEINHHYPIGNPTNPHALDRWREVPDPNAMMARPGSHFMRRPCPYEPQFMLEVVSRSIVIDPALIVPTGGWVPRPELLSRTDAVIYEMHIRDFTISHTSGVSPARRGKFLGAVERGTTTTHNGVTVSTGLDHLIELGVTHVHIMPANDFKGADFGWGYEPWNFNVPQDGFSMTPYDYVNRIYEFKTMVNEFHRAGIRVILDKVFNHTARTTFLYDSVAHRNFNNGRSTGVDSNPHVIRGNDEHAAARCVVNLGQPCPRVRSRGTLYGISHRWYLEHGEYGWHGPITGVANTLNNEHPMVERYFRDSLELWVTQYNISGFRFDLMGTKPMRVFEAWGLYFNAAIPAGQTRTSPRYQNVYSRSRFAERKIIFYGEPWAASNAHGVRPEDFAARNEYVRMGFMGAASPNAHIGVFNADAMRRPIRGSLNDGGTAGLMWQESLSSNVNANNNYLNILENAFKGSPLHSPSYIGNIRPNAWDPFFTNLPEQSINYLFAHDNLSAYDRWRVSNNNWGGAPHRTVTLGHAAMIFAQGIPFIFGGDEFLRSKYFHGSNNNHQITYNTHHHPDRYNAIDWTRKVTHYQTFRVFADMIYLRRTHPHFRMNCRDLILGVGQNSTANQGLVRTTRSTSPNDQWIRVHIESPDPTSEWREVVVKFIFRTGGYSWINLTGMGDEPWNLAFTSANGMEDSRSFHAGPNWHQVEGRNTMLFYRARGGN